MLTPGTAVSDRFQLIEVPAALGAASFADDVAAGLRASTQAAAVEVPVRSRRIGALRRDHAIAGNTICRTPRRRFCANRDGRSCACSGGRIDFLELGSGSAVKTRLLIAEALRGAGQVCAIARSTSRPTRCARRRWRWSNRFRAFRYARTPATTSTGTRVEDAAVRPAHAGDVHRGSNIGNYEPAQARHLLKLLARRAAPRGRPASSAPISRIVRSSRRRTDDPVGVTAASTRICSSASTTNWTATSTYEESRSYRALRRDARQRRFVLAGAPRGACRR